MLTFFSWALEDLGVQSIIQIFLQINYSRLFQSIIRPSSQLGTRGPRTPINHSNLFQSFIHHSSAWHSRTYDSNQSFSPFPTNQSFTHIQFGALMDLQELSVIQTGFQSIIHLQLGTRGPTRAINHLNPFQSIIQTFSINHSPEHSRLTTAIIQTFSNQSIVHPFGALMDLQGQSTIQPFPINQSPFFSWALEDLREQSVIQTFPINYSLFFSWAR